MQARWWRTAAALVALGACTVDAHDAGEVERAGTAAAPARTPAPALTRADTAEARARVEAAAESLRAAFARARPLTPREVAELRFDVNATQLASARELGSRVSSEAERERLLREGRLVALPDSTPYWILREMEHAAPCVTPDAAAMLAEIGRRFHARLDRLGLPRYRFKVTSALRTAADQEALRRVNPNAAWTASAHEFGTTVDVSHERFAVPAGPWEAAGEPHVPELEVEALEEVGKEHARVLQAELGRAVWELREAGVLHVMMEDAQPVYHMTVARALPRPAEAAALVPYLHSSAADRRGGVSRIRTGATMNRTIWMLAAAAVLAGCTAEVEDRGEAPDVDVQGGRAPQVDVDPARVEVGTDTQTVEVPDVDVTPADRTP